MILNSLHNVLPSRYGSEYNGDESNDGSQYSYDGTEGGAGTSGQARQRLHSNIQEEEEAGRGRGQEQQKGERGPGTVATRELSQRCDSVDRSDLSEPSVAGPNSQEKPLTSPTIVSVTDILTYQVWRQSKNAREILSRNFNLNIDDLFTLLFTNSKFFYDFQAERKTFDIVQCPWQHSESSDDKYREVSYTMNLNHSIGRTEITF